MMNDNDIVKVLRLKGVKLRNVHNGCTFPKQDVLLIEYRNGDKRKIDLMSERDITNVDYMEILSDDKTKIENIFTEDGWGV